jgi:hypothetical protein
MMAGVMHTAYTVCTVYHMLGQPLPAGYLQNKQRSRKQLASNAVPHAHAPLGASSAVCYWWQLLHCSLSPF